MIINLYEASDMILEQAAVVLFEAAKSFTLSTWPTLQFCRGEVENCLREQYLCLGYIRKDELAGWIGLRPQYGGYTWKIHPLVVHPHHQSTGIGSDLLYEAEKLVYEKGGRNLFIGVPDELEQTSLGGKDIFKTSLFDQLKAFEAGNGRHPGGFFLKNGYTLTGIIPDALGKGRPDILMIKPLNP